MEKVAVVVTALPVEYAAVRQHVKALAERQDAQGTIYEVGRVRDWLVWLAEIGAGNTNAAARVERLLAFIQPSPTVALFVGVAGGVKDVGLGEVVAATKVYAYESGKDADGGFLSRPDVGLSSYRLLERARIAARRFAACSVRLGPIAAGEKIVAGNRTATAEFIRAHYGDAVAVEMEGRGFLAALEAHRDVDALVVRGISDLLGGKTKADAAGWQKTASKNAAEFAFHLLRRYGPQRIEPVARPAVVTRSPSARGSGEPRSSSPTNSTLADPRGGENSKRWQIELEGNVTDLTSMELKEIHDSLQHAPGVAKLVIRPVADQGIVLVCETSASDQFRQSLSGPEFQNLCGFRMLTVTPASDTEPLAEAKDIQWPEANHIQWCLQNIVEREVRNPSPHCGEPKENENRDERISLLLERGELTKSLANQLRRCFSGGTYRHPIDQTWTNVALAARVRRQRLTQWLKSDFQHHIVWHHRPFDIGNLFAAIAVEVPAFDYDYRIFAKAAAAFNEDSKRRFCDDYDRIPIVPMKDFVEVLEFRALEISRLMKGPASHSEWQWPHAWGLIHFNGPVLSYDHYPGPDQRDKRVDLERLDRAIVRYRQALQHDTTKSRDPT